jgi:hypothetical protein
MLVVESGAWGVRTAVVDGRFHDSLTARCPPLPLSFCRVREWMFAERSCALEVNKSLYQNQEATVHVPTFTCIPLLIFGFASLEHHSVCAQQMNTVRSIDPSDTPSDAETSSTRISA